jgi:hypothetical protein
MPRTRNITRGQWDAANSANANVAHDHESEKENEHALSAQSRSGTAAGQRGTRSTAGRTVLGGISTTSAVRTATKGKTAAAKPKDKGKGKTTVTKKKKQPLQDITKHFVPAPEAANRGQGVAAAITPSSEAAAEVISAIALAPSPAAEHAINAVPVDSRPTFPSSLPPSSPPSASSFSSPIHAQPLLGAFQHLLPAFSPSGHAFSGAPKREPEVNEAGDYDPWNSFDVRPSDDAQEEEGNDNPTPTNSDPFGFFALEKKLQVERDEKQDNEYEDQWEDGGLILVADTSSPRNVPRLSQEQKRALATGQVTDPDAEDEDEEEGPYFHTPPTPHKSKKKRRISFEVVEDPDKDLFSVHTSSAPSSPSPSKLAESRKRKPSYDYEQADNEAEEPEVDFLEEAEKAKDKKRARISGAPAVATEEGTQLRRGRSASSKRKAVDGEAEADDNELPEKKQKLKTKVETVKPTSKTARTKSKMKQNKKEADPETQEVRFFFPFLSMIN